MTPRTQAIVTRFCVFLLAAELPIVTVQLQQATFDWKLVLAALLVPVGAALEKAYAPQLSSPGAEVAPVGAVKAAESHPLDSLVPEAVQVTPEVSVVPESAPHSS